jgi:phospholipid N-methyltransferase
MGPTASIVPSSRYLAGALTKPIDFRRARTILELGPGTGPVTKAILNRMRPDAKLLAVDINAAFIDHLRDACSDPRLTPVCGSATDLRSILARHHLGSADAVVSSLGLTSMDPRTRIAILRQIGECLVPGGPMTQFQYVHAYPGHLDVQKLRFSSFNELRFLRRYFRSIHTGHVLLNFPPALVFTCREYKGAG